MTPEELSQHDATALAALVRAGEVSVADTSAAAVEAARRCTPFLGFAVEVFDDAPRNGTPPHGPLFGVPFMVKDAFEYVTGELSEHGSVLSRGYRASTTSEFMRRMLAAGPVNIGRSSVPEWCWSSTCRTIANGLTRNPWNPDRFPGGSSSGSAVAVAAGVVPFAIANDGGGSTRGPAGYCGLVGMKQSRGRVSDAPWFDAIHSMSATLGVTRSVRDTALLLDVAAGSVRGDFHVLPTEPSSYSERFGRPPRQLRVAVSTTSPSGSSVNPEVVAATLDVASTLEAAGHIVEFDAPRYDYAAYLDALHVIWSTSMAVTCDWMAGETGRVASADTLMRTTWSMVLDGRKVTGAQLLAAMDQHNEVRRSVGALMDRYDLLVTPTNADVALPHASQDQDLAYEGIEWTRHMFSNDAFLPVHNTSGQPAISLPTAISSDGLPIGVQLATDVGTDGLLLQVAQQVEDAMPWQHRRPPFHVAHWPVPNLAEWER